MNEIKLKIFNIITDYCNENPNQRLGQILFNLNINEFKKESEEIRDIYNDSDKNILERIEARTKELKNKNYGKTLESYRKKRQWKSC